jgi:SAM-dependent methyltransferase
MAETVESFYDEFSRRFVNDVVEGNERMAQQLDFFSRAVPPGAESILVVGSGSGQGAHHLAARVAKRARVVALDISSENLRFARALFAHPRVEYRKADVTREVVEGRFDVIALPDVYEHIPPEARAALHARFNELLTEDGRILFTIPSPGKQESLREAGHGLQVIDETITLADLERVARDVGGELTYFNLVSVWEANDYAHAVVERRASRVRPIGDSDRLPLKGWPHPTLLSRGRAALRERLRLEDLSRSLRRRRVMKRLGANSA